MIKMNQVTFENYIICMIWGKMEIIRYQVSWKTTYSGWTDWQVNLTEPLTKQHMSQEIHFITNSVMRMVFKIGCALLSYHMVILSMGHNVINSASAAHGRWNDISMTITFSELLAHCCWGVGDVRIQNVCLHQDRVVQSLLQTFWAVDPRLMYQ